jgi:hypothetical protein
MVVFINKGDYIMDLEKLKQMDNKNEQNRQIEKENKMGIPINKWKAKVNSEEFENKLQKELEEELNDGYRLSIRFIIGYDISRYDYASYINVYGRFNSRENYITGVGLDDNYNYFSDDVEKLAKSMYDILKDRLEELGFIITKEDGELEEAYPNKETEIKLYLKVR